MKNLITVAFALLLIGLPGCVTDAKLKKHAHQYYALHPDEFATDCSDKFPVKVLPGIPSFKSDTTRIPGIVVPCPDQLTINPLTHDTIRIPGKKIECPPSSIIHDTLKLHDTILPTALLSRFEYDTAAKGQALRQTTTKLSEAEKRAKNRLFWLIGTWVLIAGGVVLIFKLK